MHMLIEWGPILDQHVGRQTPLMVAAGVDFVEGQDKWPPLVCARYDRAAERASRVQLASIRLDINAANNKGRRRPRRGLFGGTMLAVHGRARRQHERGQPAGQTPADHAGRISGGSFIAHTETGEVLAPRRDTNSARISAAPMPRRRQEQR